MSIKNFTDFNLPQNAYATFDATTLKQLIIERLNESSVFRDQNYEGSNLNSFIDIVAVMYNVLLFYLNTTASETTFTTATLYENINKLVANIGYKPTGKQTSLTTLTLSGASGLPRGAYTLPKFSFINANGIIYTTIEDISFEKVSTSTEQLALNNNLLMQGTIAESSNFTALGEPYEVLPLISTLGVTDYLFIADNSFTIYVKSSDDETWTEWSETSSLYLSNGLDKVYEKRLNENNNYEFKFGNNITGLSLKAGDAVKIFYVVSNGVQGVIGPSILNGNLFNLYNSSTFQEIVQDIYTGQITTIAPQQLQYLLPSNANSSSPVTDAESVDDIRNNAPKIFNLQNRLVTASDYEAYISKNFSSVVKGIKILSNDDFTSKYIKYFYTIGLTKPNDDCRVLFNQVNYSTSTNFNNVYCFCVPKISTILNEQTPNYLNPTQKQLIINECNQRKDLTHNIICTDPVYKAFSFGVQQVNEIETIDNIDDTILVVKRDINSKLSINSLKSSIQTVISDYFNSLTLGSVVNVATLTSNILALEGVKSLSTRRVSTGYEVPQLSFTVWNPLYPEDDITITSQNVSLDVFMFPFFYNKLQLSTKITIVNE